MKKPSKRAAITLLAAASSVAGCNLLLGLDQFVDACPEVEQGLDCPDAGAGGATSTTTTGTSASSGAAGGTAGSGPTACAPGDTRHCYDGPTQTEDVGACQHGIETCAADGSAWGPCDGEKTPKPETCESTDDEDCDGLDCVVSAVSWPGDGQPGSLTLTAIAATPDGGFALAGAFVGDQTFAGQALSDPTSAGSAFLMKTDATGAGLWAMEIATASLAAVAVDSAGEIYAIGLADQATSVGSTSLSAGHFVLKDDASGGLLWASSLGGSNAGCTPSLCGAPASIAIMSNGDALIGGTFGADMDFGDGPVAPINGSRTAYVALLDGATGLGSSAASGARWARVFPGPGSVEGRTRTFGPYVSATTDGRANAAFNFDTTFTLDSGTFSAQGGTDVGVIRLLGTGTVQLTSQFGDADSQVVLTSSTTPQNALLIGGTYLGAMTDGFHTITAQSQSGAAIGPLYGDGFLIEVADGSSQVQILHGFGTAGQVDAAVGDGQGGINVACSFSGSADVLGGGIVDAQSGVGVLVGRLNADTTVAWQRSYTEAQQTPSLTLAVSADRSLALGGAATTWPFSLDTVALNSSSQPMVGFLGRFAP